MRLKLSVLALLAQCICAYGAQFSLELSDPKTKFGPFSDEVGSKVTVGNASLVVVDAGVAGSIKLKSEQSGNVVGPFEIKNGAKMKLGAYEFAVRTTGAGNPVATAAKEVPEVKSIVAQADPSAPTSARINAKERSGALLDEMFNKPAEEKAQAEADAVIAEARAQQSGRDGFELLSKKISDLYFKSGTPAVEGVVAIAKEQFKMIAEGRVGNISGMSHTIDLLVKKGVSKDQIVEMLNPFVEYDDTSGLKHMKKYLAEAYLENSMWSDAETLYKELIESRDAWSPASKERIALAKVYHGKGEKGKMLTILKELDDEAKGAKEDADAVGWFALAGFYESLGQTENSFTLHEAIVRNPKLGLSLRNRALERLNGKRKEKGMLPIAPPKDFNQPAPEAVAKKPSTSVFEAIEKRDDSGLTAILKDNPDAVKEIKKGQTPRRSVD